MSNNRGMNLSVEVEKPSSILRKMKIKVPATVVKSYFERGLVAVQKTADLKGFRKGQAPIAVIKQFYGADIRHRVLHNLIDESFEEAVKEQELKTVGHPKIATPHSKTGEGEHDHSLNENEDLSYEATVEVMPELKVKGYTGLSLSRDKVEVTEDQVKKVTEQMLQSHAQMTPVAGLIQADGTQSSRPIQKSDFVDLEISGDLVTSAGLEPREELKNTRLDEVGHGTWLKGFSEIAEIDEKLVGMKRGETHKFRLTLPKDSSASELAGKEVELSVTIHEVKERKLPELDDEFVKQFGYENVADFNAKAKEYLVRERTDESEQKIRGELVSKLIEKNPFDVPAAMVEAQTHALANDWARNLQRQGIKETMIKEIVLPELENLKKRAESQVRASLLLESIAKVEDIKVSEADVSAELDRLADAMQVDRKAFHEHYAKNPSKKDDLEFRLRQDLTIKFLLDKAKIKEVSVSEK